MEEALAEATRARRGMVNCILKRFGGLVWWLVVGGGGEGGCDVMDAFPKKCFRAYSYMDNPAPGTVY